MHVVGDRYELRDPVGSGGMAQVVEAHDRLLERPVAVKLLRDDIAADPMARARFLQEARTAAQFTHPNAVAVYDSGGDEDAPWIVMELVDGENLSERLAREGALDEAQALRIADCFLAALEAAHRDGIVHRDVKPENIMLLADGSVKLADFGIAKSLDDVSGGMTATGQITGTPHYLSPEQVEGASATPASDVYAAGIVLYEMLVGSPPYTGDDLIAVAVAHRREPVPDLAGASAGVSPELAAVVTRALAKDPADRYADAGEMRRALPAGDRTLVAPVAATVPIDDGVGVMRGAASSARRAARWSLAAVVLLAAVAALALMGGAGTEEPTQPAPAADTAGEADDAAGDDAADDGAGDATTRDGGAGDGKGEARGKEKENGGKGKGKAKGRD